MMNQLGAAAGMASHDSGSALALLQQWASYGGPVLVILALVSVVALAVVVVKLQQFVSTHVWSRRGVPEALAHWRMGRGKAALEVLADVSHPVARVLGATIGACIGGQGDQALVREEVQRLAAAEIERLRSHFRLLEVIASVSPLLGLLGTVLGMITAFQELSTSGAAVNPALLSNGIWEALLTTAAGLGIAIPVVAVLNGLERTVERVSHDMEDAVTQVFTRALMPASVAAPATSTTTRLSSDAY